MSIAIVICMTTNIHNQEAIKLEQEMFKELKKIDKLKRLYLNSKITGKEFNSILHKLAINNLNSNTIRRLKNK